MKETIATIQEDLRWEANMEGREQGLRQVEFWIERGLSPQKALHRVWADMKAEKRAHDELR